MFHIELRIREINEPTAGSGVQTDMQHDCHILCKEQMCTPDKPLCASVLFWVDDYWIIIIPGRLLTARYRI